MDVTPSLDPDGHYAQLNAAVGSLFLQWAMLENEMSASLRRHLTRKMRNRDKGMLLACSIYGSMRMKASRDTMKRIIVESDCGPKPLAFHEAFFMHIGHLETLRDKLAHQATVKANKEYDGIWHVTDIVTTRSYRNHKVFEFTTDAVTLAAADLYKAAHCIGGLLTKADRRSAPELPTWQYKQAMLAPHDRRRPTSRAKPQRPPKSSPA